MTHKLAPDLRDLVTRYLPDDILVDGEWENDSDFWETKQFLEWLFNESPVKDSVAVNDRWGNETRGAHGGYYVCENGAYSTFCNGSYGGPAHPVSDHPWIYWATTCPQVRLSLSITSGLVELLSHCHSHRVHGASAAKKAPMTIRARSIL